MKAKEIEKISKRDLLIAGVALYWAEGTRSSNKEQTAFSNSSLEMILFIIRWFREVFNVLKNRFTVQVRINKIHKNRVKEI